MITLISAPSNLGLRPPEAGSVPGTSKAPEALREAGLYSRLMAQGALDAGVVIPGRYVFDDPDREPGHVRNEEQLVDHARRLASRLVGNLDQGNAPLVIGGDCSLLVAAGVALAPRHEFGLVHLDGHTDFRHPGDSEVCASVGGEDLAAAIGMHWPAISNIDGLGPYFAPDRTAHIGCRDDDYFLTEVRSSVSLVVPASQAIEQGMSVTARAAAQVAGDRGYWIHLDVDILDSEYMPAVDSPVTGGLNPAQLVELLEELAPGALGAHVTIFDPDLDPTGEYASLLSDMIARGFARLGSSSRW